MTKTYSEAKTKLYYLILTTINNGTFESKCYFSLDKGKLLTKLKSYLASHIDSSEESIVDELMQSSNKLKAINYINQILGNANSSLQVFGNEWDLFHSEFFMVMEYGDDLLDKYKKLFRNVKMNEWGNTKAENRHLHNLLKDICVKVEYLI